MAEDKQQPARAVSTMSDAERRDELAQLTTLVATLTGADNKKKRGRVNGRISALRESLGISETAAPVKDAKAPEKAHEDAKSKKEDKKPRKESGAAPPRKDSGAAAPRKESGAAPRKESGATAPAAKGGKARSESKSGSDGVDVLKPAPAGKAVLGYWKIRGLAEPIRYVLEYTKTPYVEKLYQTGPAPTFDAGEWGVHKASPSLALDFPNLPYLFDGALRITQSKAILRHLARKHKLYGDNEEEMSVVDMLGDEIMDYQQKIMGISYNDKFEELLKKVKDTVLPEFAAKFEGFLGSKKYLLGNKVSYVDFTLYTLLDQANIMVTGFLDEHPKLGAYHASIRALPGIKEYLASPRFSARPINGLMAKFK